MTFELPAQLERLIATGVWPPAGTSVNAQNLRPIVPPERVRQFADDETRIFLFPPPFETMAEEVRASTVRGFWERYGALDQITPEHALIIAGFEIGSDSVVILDYSRDPVDPPVLRLRWAGGTGNAWVIGARNFDEFASILGLG